MSHDEKGRGIVEEFKSKLKLHFCKYDFQIDKSKWKHPDNTCIPDVIQKDIKDLLTQLNALYRPKMEQVYRRGFENGKARKPRIDEGKVAAVISTEVAKGTHWAYCRKCINAVAHAISTASSEIVGWEEK